MNKKIEKFKEEFVKSEIGDVEDLELMGDEIKPFKVEKKGTKVEVSEIRMPVLCVHCKHSDNKIIDRAVYCDLKNEWKSAFAIDCTDFK
jgi:hypothetical protein